MLRSRLPVAMHTDTASTLTIYWTEWALLIQTVTSSFLSSYTTRLTTFCHTVHSSQLLTALCFIVNSHSFTKADYRYLSLVHLQVEIITDRNVSLLAIWTEVFTSWWWNWSWTGWQLILEANTKIIPKMICIFRRGYDSYNHMLYCWS